ncbi:hypothetical protein AVEN_19472-1 [Araneus ventricosus]|uniref:Uncharacterized protein n=1 Tax=Araneus ventricosus TaxID=182803 RepID=A0A4Y2C6J8_ARAVE|nr:hypothetical protein AVEN_19472-1 [Araneus ventricosus]
MNFKALIKVQSKRIFLKTLQFFVVFQLFRPIHVTQTGINGCANSGHCERGAIFLSEPQSLSNYECCVISAVRIYGSHGLSQSQGREHHCPTIYGPRTSGLSRCTMNTRSALAHNTAKWLGNGCVGEVLNLLETFCKQTAEENLIRWIRN